MAEYPFTPVTGKLRMLLSKILEVGKPSKANRDWLKQLGFTSSNDASMITMLKYIGFIDASNVPTSRWNEYRGAHPKKVLAEAIREGYSDLFAVYPDADKRTQAELEAVVRSSTSSGAQVVTKTVKTFQVLVEEADFSASIEPRTTDAEQAQQTGRVQSVPAEHTPQQVTSISNGPSLHIDLQVHIAADASSDQIEKIFESMAKHLYGR